MKLASLRWPSIPNQFDKYAFWPTGLATVVSTLFLFGCDATPTATAVAANDYIGVWEHASAPYLTMTITQQGDQFRIHKMANNKSIPIDPDRLANLRNGLLQFNDGSGIFFEYHKENKTITSSGNSEFLYRKKN